MHKYNPKEIEPKWQQAWEDAGIFKAQNGDTSREKLYSLETFPYPSAAGLHVGHPEGYTAEDIHARFARMNGHNVLYCIGWDAFGLPTENYAIKLGKNPKDVAAANIANFKRQVKMFGFSYDWDREINTSDPAYYKWTQWIFLQLFNKGLAYRKNAPVNWCDHCKTVLAREQVIGGQCERCHTAVVQKDMEQWFFKITEYAEELLSDLETVDVPESTKEGQHNWIGKSEGVEVEFRVQGTDEIIKVFTTRVDTLFSAAFLVLAPEHPLVESVATDEHTPEVTQYVQETLRKTELMRSSLAEKTGVFTGAYAINPANEERIPIWIGDFVIASYGTGAVFGDAHDERDFDMAKKYHIALTVSIRPHDETLWEKVKNLEVCYTGDGILVNSGQFDGLTSVEARGQIGRWLESGGKGRSVINYRLRDWLVSRQRYWGAPIPIIWCRTCGAVPVPESQLPVLLPDDVDFTPTGQPPLASSPSFVNVKCPVCKAPARRDAETMDTFVDSSWYFLRYCSPQETSRPFNKKDVDYWMPVDLYVIGAEHITLHLLYARFLTKALADLQLLSFREPFRTIRHIGLILGADGQKMSKSRGNVVNPDDVVSCHGADAVRMYEMFMGPLEDAKPWSTEGIVGITRFLEKVWRIAEQAHDNPTKNVSHSSSAYKTLLHQTIKKVTDDVKRLHYNTAIAQMMILINALGKATTVTREDCEVLLKILHPFAPHITEELWHTLGHTSFLMQQSWPTYDETTATADTIELVVQVNGKVRERYQVAAGLSDEELTTMALQGHKVQPFLTGKSIVDVIVVRGRLVNVVVK